MQNMFIIHHILIFVITCSACSYGIISNSTNSEKNIEDKIDKYFLVLRCTFILIIFIHFISFKTTYILIICIIWITLFVKLLFLDVELLITGIDFLSDFFSDFFSDFIDEFPDEFIDVFHDVFPDAFPDAFLDVLDRNHIQHQFYFYFDYILERLSSNII